MWCRLFKEGIEHHVEFLASIECRARQQVQSIDCRQGVLTLQFDMHFQVRTHFARPNWKKVFSRLASIHKGARIGMFSLRISVTVD